MAVYRIKLFTGEPDKRNECLDEKNPRIAIGWNVDDAKNYNDYCKKAKKIEVYCKDSENLNYGLKNSLEYLVKSTEGSLVWTQIGGRDYRLGRIPKDAVVEYDNYLGPCIRCKLEKIEFDDVPGKIISCFVGRGIVFRKVNLDSYMEKYCEWLYEGKKAGSLKLDSFKSLLHYDDLEDLAGLYLQENRNYYIIPSTNKQGGKLIEYELRDEHGNKACIQCKIGDSGVKTNEICDNFEGYKIFICVIDDSNKGTYTDNSKNIEEIPFEVLYNWAKEHNAILPQRIQNFLSLTND